jgi:hypothetical protein
MPIPIFGYNETSEDCSPSTPDNAMRLPRREASNARMVRVAGAGRDPDRIPAGGAADVLTNGRQGMRNWLRRRAGLSVFCFPAMPPVNGS